MTPSKLAKWGGIGTAFFGICCFTPALVILFGFLGVSAWLAWVDYVLLPMLVVSSGVMIYGLAMWRRTTAMRSVTHD
jgi:mercuric ion transport protein